MKRTFIIALSILVLLNLSACNFERIVQLTGPQGGLVNPELDKSASDSIAELIINDLENKSVEALKDMFLQAALDEIKNIDVGIASVMKLFDGEVINFEGSVKMASKVLSKESYIQKINADYVIETSEARYKLEISFIAEDSVNPENLGVYALTLIRLEDSQSKEQVAIIGSRFSI